MMVVYVVLKGNLSPIVGFRVVFIELFSCEAFGGQYDVQFLSEGKSIDYYTKSTIHNVIIMHLGLGEHKTSHPEAYFATQISPECYLN